MIYLIIRPEGDGGGGDSESESDLFTGTIHGNTDADLLAGSMRHERQGTGHHNLRTLPRSYLAGYRATH